MRAPALVLRYLRYGHNVLQFAKLMFQQHDDVEPPARATWTQACPMPAEQPTIENTSVAPIRLKKRETARPHDSVA
jgi:hypothetical protein